MTLYYYTMARADIIPELLKKLEHPDTHTRWDAAIRLREFLETAEPAGDYRFRMKDALIPLLSDEYHLTRLETAKTLSALGYTPDSETDTLCFLFAARNWEELQARGTEILPFLFAAAEDPEWEIRREAVHTLTDICRKSPDSAVDFMMQFLSAATPIQKETAAEILGNLPRAADIPGARRVIEALLNDTSQTVRGKAAVAAGFYGSTSLIPALTASFGGCEHDGREAVLWALEKMKSRGLRVHPALRRLRRSINHPTLREINALLKARKKDPLMKKD